MENTARMRLGRWKRSWELHSWQTPGATSETSAHCAAKLIQRSRSLSGEGVASVQTSVHLGAGGPKLDKFEELKLASQNHLVEFLRVELELIETFREMARSTTDADHRRRLEEEMQVALQTLRKFEERVTDPVTRNEIHAQANKIIGIRK